MTLNCPSTTVDSDSAETSGKGRKSTINKNYECVVRLARRTAVTRFKHQVGSIPTTLTNPLRTKRESPLRHCRLSSLPLTSPLQVEA